jgi:tRNA-modifying protein YgfZ
LGSAKKSPPFWSEDNLTDVQTQVAAARRSVLAVPHRDLVTLVVTGGDRLSWLNGLLTCDLSKRGPDDATYGLVVGRNGRVVSDAVVVVDEPRARALVVAPSGVAEALRAHLDHHLVMEDAEIAAGAGAFEPWALHGPRSADVLGAACASGATGGRADRTGLGGAFVLVPEDASTAARAAIRRLVSEAAGVVGDESGWEALRLERGVPRFGVDFDDKTYPQEASLEKVAVSFTKGCYLGQEVVFMLEKRGHVKRRLAPIVLGGSRVPDRGDPVTDPAGASVGEITSAARSPTLGKPVAFAMLKRAVAEPGNRVAVSGVPGDVVERPA